MTYLERMTMRTYRYSDLCFAPYYGRKPNEKYGNYFSGDYYYPNAGKETSIRLCLEVKLDEDGRISEFDYYKVKDLSYGAGRPQSDVLELNRTDIKKFTKALDDCTDSKATDALNDLIAKAKDSLTGEWTISKEGKRDFVFSSSDGKDIKISRKTISDIFEMSFEFLEVLYLDAFWKANADVLDREYKEPLLALFSLADYSIYPNIETLRKEAQDRAEEIEAVRGIELLAAAANDNNKTQFNKYVKYAGTELYSGSGYREPIFYAVENNNADFVKGLIENGADIDIERLYYREEKVHENMETPLSYAIRTGRRKIADILLEKSADVKLLSKAVNEAIKLKSKSYIIKLAQKGAIIYTDDIESFFSEKDLRGFIGLDNVKWDLDHIKEAYSKGEWDILQSMIKASESRKNVPSYVHMDGRLCDNKRPGAFSTELAKWVCDTGDIKLKLCVDNIGCV